ncbi:phage portal protein [Enterococcus faecalis]|uniref:phage portal protein n=1 Tax=Enterococcus faecalis TaxID=1351 RepID=UPI000A230E81|nr:phage portal protein [Enterococcus faecalis]OSH43860.1 capsid protein [Enterococcus faecalis]OSH47292.1 capsid protein [Enterococcus faecalis]
MKFIEAVKGLFKRGGYALTGQELTSINDHPKVNIDPLELQRIEQDFKEYRNDYGVIEYVNSNNEIRKRKYMALNMRKLTAEMMASLVFNEQVDIKVDDEQANEYIQHVFEHNDFKKNMTRYLEPMFAAGGLAIRPYVDMNTGEMEFSWALANAFYPLRSTTNGVSEGVMLFKTVETENSKTVYYTLLEFHEWINGNVKITNELYRSEEANKIGKRVQLGYKGQYEGLSESANITDMKKPLFNYLKPAGFNNFSLYSPLGIGICDNSVNTLKQINDAYDQFNWEIRMGQRTVIVSDHVLDYHPDEQGNSMKPIFDPDVNIYRPMRMEQDSELIKDITNDIRTEQYISAINQFMKTLEMQMQLSVGTFSFDGKSVKTATEVASENSLTYRTRNMQCNEVEKFIKGLVVSTLELAKRTIYQGKSLYTGKIPNFEEISVDFDDGIFSNLDQKLEFFSKAKIAGLVPVTEALKGIFKLTDEEAVRWYQRIQQEEAGLDPSEIEEFRVSKELGDEE